ncbi:MAG: hypothetical protein GXP46_12965 [Deferribacteres bacterium]|nr:hypothetical protein [Deferribacteres bacterium]
MRSGFNRGTNRFTVSVMTQRTYDILRVRWWAIGATTELEPLEIEKPGVDSGYLISKIALNPGITMKTLIKETGLRSEEISEEIEKLIETGNIKVSGTGLNRKFKIVTTG